MDIISAFIIIRIMINLRYIATFSIYFPTLYQKNCWIKLLLNICIERII